jgi:hypothetical protein
MIANFRAEALTIPEATVLGIAEEVSESVVNKINANRSVPEKPPRKKHNCSKGN